VSALALGLLLGQLTSLSPAGYRGTLSLADRSEARLRSNIGAPDALDLENIPTLVADLTGRRSSFLVGYGPRLALLDATGDSSFAVMHNGRFTASTWSKRVRWTLNVNGSIGLQSAAGLGVTVPLTEAPTRGAAAPGAATGAAPLPPGSTMGTPGMGTGTAGAPAAQGPQPNVVYYIPPSAVLYTGAFRGSLSVTDTFSKRWTGTLSGFYQMSGGVDFTSQLAYPPNRGGGGDAIAGYTLSREDSLLSFLHGEYTYVLTTNDKFFVTTYVESIRHAFSLRTVGTLGAGVSMVVRRLAKQNALSGAVAGAGEAAIAHTVPLREHGTYAVRAAANLGQDYNPYLGIVQWLATATLSSAWIRDPWSATATAAAVTSLPIRDADAARTASGTLTLGYALSEAVQVQSGVRAYTQLFPSQVSASYPPQWVVFAALLLTAPPAKF